jgi:hypothetical protein
MLTSEERIRALINNISSWSWDIYPKFEIEKEDAEALRDFLKNDTRLKGCFHKEKWDI